MRGTSHGPLTWSVVTYRDGQQPGPHPATAIQFVALIVRILPKCAFMLCDKNIDV